MAKNKNSVIYWACAMLGICVFGLSFDAYWHLTRGRDILFSLPHVFIYIGTVGAILSAWRGTRVHNNMAWRLLLNTLLILPLAAIMDEAWHRIIGVEKINSVSMVWSVPHLIAFICGLVALTIVSLIVRSDLEPKSRNLVGPVMIGCYLSLAYVLLSPLLTVGPHALFGMAGFGVMAAVYVFVLLLCRSLFPVSGSMAVAAMIFTLLQVVIFDAGQVTGEGIRFLSMPAWFAMVVFIGPAVFLEWSRKRLSNFPKGILAGAIMAMLYLLLGASFIKGSSFTYGDLWVGTFSAAIGGLIAGAAHEYWHIKNTEPAD